MRLQNKPWKSAEQLGDSLQSWAWVKLIYKAKNSLLYSEFPETISPIAHKSHWEQQDVVHLIWTVFKNWQGIKRNSLCCSSNPLWDIRFLWSPWSLGKTSVWQYWGCKTIATIVINSGADFSWGAGGMGGRWWVFLGGGGSLGFLLLLLEFFWWLFF